MRVLLTPLAVLHSALLPVAELGGWARRAAAGHGHGVTAAAPATHPRMNFISGHAAGRSRADGLSLLCLVQTAQNNISDRQTFVMASPYEYEYVALLMTIGADTWLRLRLTANSYHLMFIVAQFLDKASCQPRARGFPVYR